jgi:hypothetical protein
MKKVIILASALFSFNTSANPVTLTCFIASEYRGIFQANVVTLPFEGEQSEFVTIENYDIEINKLAKDKTFNLTLHKNAYIVYEEIVKPEEAIAFQDEDLSVSALCIVEE